VTPFGPAEELRVRELVFRKAGFFDKPGLSNVMIPSAAPAFSSTLFLLPGREFENSRSKKFQLF